MRIYEYPQREQWLDILKRPIQSDSQNEAVKEIIHAVVTNGDEALFKLSQQFDGVEIKELRVTEAEIELASGQVPEQLKQAIRNAKANIDKFHRSQVDSAEKIETTAGVWCWRRSLPIERVGIYVPAGSAPLFSTVLMLAVPAQIAGCKEIVMCVPPNTDGSVNDTVLFTASLCGITDIYKIGGAQAIAAMAYGTESIPKVYKIFGPGNQYVTTAKKLVSVDVPIDMPAGPSEVAILADGSCAPSFVAADLLAQAEHGEDSQVVLVTDSNSVLNTVIEEIDRQLEVLPRKAVAEAALRNSVGILVDTVESGLHLLNEYAAEHLILAVENADEIAMKVKNAGSVFIGNYSCESAGDYATGTNHTLPTGGYARSYSGVSLDSFVKKITFQKLSAEGIKNIGPDVEILAKAEGLDAHKNAVSLRLKKLK